MIKLIIGCGYLGMRVARHWRDAGYEVVALTRSTQAEGVLAATGIRPLVGDVLEPGTLSGLPESDSVLFAIAADRQHPQSPRAVHVDGLRNVLAALPAGTRRVIYISSTGVYGQADGRWVDEDTVCRPERDGGAACLAAERLLAGLPWSQRSVVLRLGGLYGPGRIPRRRDLLASRPVAAPVEGYLNLIHVDDAARAVLAVAEDESAAGVFCLTDGNPVPRRDYYCHLAQLLGAPPLRFVTPPADAPATRRASSSKRVSNARFQARFALRFVYPSYREGLAQAVAAEQAAQP
jgi:nucleoside-diphosphate-sugar epimerase